MILFFCMFVFYWKWRWFMLGLHDIQYLYEFIFWLVTFLLLRIVWHKPSVRLAYGYIVAGFNLFAIIMYTLSSLSGQMSGLDSFSFGFLHAMVSVVMLTLIHKEIKIEKRKKALKWKIITLYYFYHFQLLQQHL